MKRETRPGPGPRPGCGTCRHRAWRQVAGFTVLCCGLRGLRFGLATDLRRGYINRDGACVPQPKECQYHEASQHEENRQSA